MAIPAPSRRPPAPPADAAAPATDRALPGFAAILDGLVPERPLLGARIACTLPATSAAAVLVGALRSLGGSVRWASQGPGRAHHLFDWPDAVGPNLLVEHGAAASRLIHRGTRFEGRAGRTATRSYAAIATAILGTTEVDPRGAAWFARQSERGELLYPAVDGTPSALLADLASAERTLETSEVLSVALLALVSMFRAPPGGAALSRPSAAILRAVASAHAEVVRSRVEKLRFLAPGRGGSTGGSGSLRGPAA